MLLALCNNLTSSVKCQSQDAIDRFFNSKKIAYLINDNLLALDDYEQPIKPKISAKYFSLDTKVRKFHTMNLQKIVIDDDDGLFLSYNKLTESWKIGDTIDDFDFVNDELFSIVIYSTNKETYATRKYMKIQNVLGAWGGIVNVLISVGFIFLNCSPFNSINVFLSNNLFSFHSTVTNEKFDKPLINNIKETLPAKDETKQNLKCKDDFDTLNTVGGMLKFEINQKNDNHIKPCIGDNEKAFSERSFKINVQDLRENFKRKAPLIGGDSHKAGDRRNAKWIFWI